MKKVIVMVSLCLFPRLLVAHEVDLKALAGEYWYGLYLNGQKVGFSENALSVDDTGAVKEVRFDTPVPLHLVHTLHLPTQGEIELHRSVSEQCERLGVPQLNPYAASLRADDKARSHRLWSAASSPIRSPKMALVPRGSSIFDAHPKVHHQLCKCVT